MFMALGINLPQGTTGSSLFLSLLQNAAAGTALEPVASNLNKHNLLGDGLLRFEAARVALPWTGRVDMAERLVRLSQETMIHEGSNGSHVPLSEYFRDRAAPLPVTTRILGNVTDIRRIPYRGRVYEREGIRELAERQEDQYRITAAASQALDWIAGADLSALRGRKVAVLGGGAALAPTELLLLAGAHVLYIDRTPAPEFLAKLSAVGGTITFTQEPADLLTDALRVRATIEEFANGEPIDIGAFAYAEGQARDWRLAASMNGIIQSLPPEIIRSVGLFVSPTSVVESAREDVNIAEARWEQRGGGEKFREMWFRRIPLLGRRLLRNHLHAEGVSFPRSIVGLQGAGYQATQYVGKRLTAEVYATRGMRFGGKKPVTTSASIAGITETPSIQAAFGPGLKGAPLMGLETYPVETTRWLSGLIYLQGILDPQSVGSVTNPFEDENTKARRLQEVQVHGGIYSYLYDIQGGIALATAMAVARDPRELATLWRMMRKKK